MINIKLQQVQNNFKRGKKKMFLGIKQCTYFAVFPA